MHDINACMLACMHGSVIFVEAVAWPVVYRYSKLVIVHESVIVSPLSEHACAYIYTAI